MGGAGSSELEQRGVAKGENPGRGGACSKRGGAGAKAGLSLPRELDEEHYGQASQQIKKQEFVHLLPHPGLPALRKEERGEDGLRTQAPRGPSIRLPS